MSRWMAGMPSGDAIEPYPGMFDPRTMRVVVIMKAMHHWIRKGDARKAALRARELANSIHYYQRLGLIPAFTD